MKLKIVLMFIVHFASICSLSAINYQMDTSSVFKIIAMPSPLIADGGRGVCKGSNYTYQSNVDASVTYKWVVSGGMILGANNQQQVTVNWTEGPWGILKLIHYKSGACNDSTSINITIHSLPVPVITGGSVNVCVDKLYTYTSNLSLGKSNKWIVTGGTISGNDNADTVNIMWGNGANGIVKLIQTSDAVGCKDSTVLNVNINPLPNPQITGSKMVCAGVTMKYYAVKDNSCSYLWEVLDGSILGSNSKDSVIVNWPYEKTGKLSLKITNTATGCKDSSGIDVKVNALPETKITAGESMVCSGKIYSYTTNSTTETSNNWVVSGGTINGSEFASTINVLWGAEGKGLVKLYKTNNSSQCMDTTSINVTIGTTPSKPDISDTTVAYDRTVLLTPKGPANCDFRWYPSQESNTPISIYNNLVLENLKRDTIVFVESLNRASGCISIERTSVKIKVAAKGELVLDMKFNQQAICKGDSVFIGLKAEMNSGEPPFTYSWTPVRNLSNPNHFETWAKPNITTEYTLKVTDKNSSEGTSTVLINVNMIPDVTFDSEDKEFCLNDEPYEIVGGSPKAGIYSGKGVADGIFNPALAGIGQHEIVYKYTSVKGCSDSATNIFEVFSMPEKPIISENKKKLTTNSALTYQWFFNDTKIDGANSQIYEPDTSGYYKVEVADNHNCKNISDPYYFDITNVEDKNDINNSISINPNPFTDKTTIKWQMNNIDKVSMTITDLLGVEILKLLDNEIYNAGQQTIEFDSSNFPSGVYLLNLKVGEKSFTVKLMIMK